MDLSQTICFEILKISTTGLTKEKAWLKCLIFLYILFYNCNLFSTCVSDTLGTNIWWNKKHMQTKYVLNARLAEVKFLCASYS